MSVNGFQEQRGQRVPPYREHPTSERPIHPIEEEDNPWEVVTIDTPEGPKRVRRRRKQKTDTKNPNQQFGKL